ncbi:hypothetical protein QUB17_11860 [Microcoleus sp. B5-C4]
MSYTGMMFTVNSQQSTVNSQQSTRIYYSDANGFDIIIAHNLQSHKPAPAGF